MVVAVESLGVAAAADDGLRLSINGWALAASPIAEISAAIDDRIVGTAVYGMERPDIAALYPGREGADHCGFILAFGLARQAQSSIEVVLSVRTADGEFGRRPLRIDIPPQEVEIGVVDRWVRQNGKSLPRPMRRCSSFWMKSQSARRASSI